MNTRSLVFLCALLTATFSVAAQLPLNLNNNKLSLQNNKTANQFNNLLEVPTFLQKPELKNSAANCSDELFAFAPTAAPCNGISVTPISFLGTSRSLVSGTDNTVGTVYKYANAGTAPDGTVVDAWVTIISYANNMDTNQTNFSAADVVGDETTTNGYDANLQPNLIQESLTYTNAATWSGNIHYQINFYRTGTTTPIRLTVAPISIDNDGAATGTNGCAGILSESVTYGAGYNQVLVNSATAPGTTQNVTALPTVSGPQANQGGIGIGSEYSNAALYVNVSQFDWTYSFNAPSSTCANGTTTGAARRLGSLNMTCQITFNRAFASVPLSGTVFNDTNGLTDSTVNGTGTNAGGLFANLVDSNGFVFASVAVAANGTYSFPTAVNGTYTVQISTTQGVESSTAPAIALPAGWVNTGEFLGAGAGNDGTTNGLGNGSLAVTVNGATVTNANFGIEQPPTAANNTAATQTNPGGANSATVPATTFSGTDTAPGTVSNIRITAFPSNATTITINGTVYGAVAGPGVTAFPAAGVTVPTNAAGNPTQAILVDPVNGAVTVVIPYVTLDNAGIASAAATASVPFATVSLSGTVFNDTNGLQGTPVNTVDGTGTNAGGLFANLLDSGGNVVASVAIPASGIYSFAGLNSGSYSVQISTNAGTVGNPAPATALPTGWVNTGEFLGTGAGNDGTTNGLSNGLLAVTVGATNVTNANFGIEQRPTANNNTAASQLNQGGTTSATVPATTFSGTDPVTTTVSSIRITAFPSNATTITINGTVYGAVAGPGVTAFPAGGVTVPTNAAGNPTQTILVDPSFAGAGSVVIRYVAIDAAGIESSTPANATVPFTTAPTAGSALLGGKLMSGDTPLRGVLVVLHNTTTNQKRVVRTDANGTFGFEEEVGNTYIVEPLSNKYSFSPSTKLVNLLDDVADENFFGTAKTYRPKNDFDGDGKTDYAVYRASEGNWYVWNSSESKMSVFHFGIETDVPVAGDFDGDGKADYAVYRPSEGNWYIWQSASQSLRVDRFGLADDKLVPADFDGDGETDVAVYRDGVWYVKNSSNGTVEYRNFGLATDKPSVEDFDGDGKADISVYRPSEANWYVLKSSNNNWAVHRFGLADDVQVAGDYDGDGYADIAQFRNGIWYVKATTTDFRAEQFGQESDRSFVGDFDGDGRADLTVYSNGVWGVHRSGSGAVDIFNFGLPTDILIK